MSRNVFLRPLLGLGIATAWLSLLGCDRTDSILSDARPADNGQSASHGVSSPLSPRQTIDECIAAYRRIDSYQDQAMVRLNYKLDGRPQADEAPLQVAWSRDGNIGLNVYSLRAGPSGDRWYLRLGGHEGAEASLPPTLAENKRDAIAQVLSRALPAKVDFEWLLSDPIATQGLSAGLAGFPPQLDLLLSDDPLGGLIDGAAMLVFEQQRVLNGRACHVIVVTRGPMQYRLVIDQASMLLRRLELPNQNLPPPMLANNRITDVALVIDFDAAIVNKPIQWANYQVEPRGDELLVNHFVTAPPIAETTGLGRRVPAFRFSGPQGEPVFESAEQIDARKITVLMWIANHPACRVAAEQLALTERAIAADPLLAGAVDFVTVWAEPQTPDGQTFAQLRQSWNLPGKLALDRAALGRDLFAVMEAPTLIVLDEQNRLQLRESRTNPLLEQVLPELLRRMVGGEDLSATTLAETTEAYRRYLAELQIATAIDAREATRNAIAARVASLDSTTDAGYAPLLVELVDAGVWSHRERVVAATTDAAQLTWTLSENGTLQCLGFAADQPQVIERIKTTWTPNKAARIVVSPDSKFVALYSSQPGSQGSQIDVCEVAEQRQTSFDLPSGASPIDVKWMRLNGSNAPRLAAVTSDHQILLLDPKNHEQLSARSDDAPIALVATTNEKSELDGRVVLASGAIEGLHLSENSAHHRLPLLGRPAVLPVSSTSTSVPTSNLTATSSGDLPTKQRLTFRPGEGPWSEWTGAETQWVLAHGWLARDEPALLMLDSQLRPRWHCRVGLLARDAQPPLVTAAEDPATGMPTWVVQAGNTLHILRADGVTDHCRFDVAPQSVVLIAEGSRLLLGLVQADQTRWHQLRWR